MCEYQLSLYIAGRTVSGRRLIRRLRNYCRRHPDATMSLEVIDVMRRARAAETAHILATPTLVCRAHGKVRRVIGDLEDIEAAMIELMIPPPPAPAVSQTRPPRRRKSRPRLPTPPIEIDHTASTHVIEKSIDAIVIIDRHGVVKFANPAAEVLLGRPAAQLIGREFGFPIAIDKFMELAVLRPDQTTVVADVRAAEIQWAGRPAYAAFLRDITERKATEAALHNREEHLRLMVEGSSDYAIMIVDPLGRIAEWNGGAERLFGYRKDEVLGVHFSRFHVDEDVASRKGERLLTAARQTGRVEDEGWRLRKDGSQFWANVVFSTIKDEEGCITGYCKITRDMTARRELERHYLELQKLELGRQLAAGVAHRFNNLMCGVMIGSELVHMKMRDDGEISEVVEIMKSSATQAARITNQLLTFSQNQPSEPRVVDLGTLFERLSAALRDTLGPSVALRVRQGEGGLWVQVDPQQIEVLIMNLAANAREAMPDGGELNVELFRAKLDRETSRTHPDLLPGAYVKLVMSDNGCGMSEEVLSHVFEPFYTTKDPRRDGLGLAVCQGIVKQNGGVMSVSSLLGEGTFVEIHFPCATETARAEVPEREPAGVARGSEAVLLVDDDEPLRKMAAASLRDLGYHVAEAGDGAQALDLLHSETLPRLDALITDGRMPKMGGKALAQALRAAHPNARILFISGYPPAPNETGVIPEFGTAALPKPFTLSGLSRRLRELLDS
ncbi:PAS domain S-box protein [bacterium]|nr:PAS domain S-box protein [bacterium]